MGMPTTRGPRTADELDELPDDGQRWEIIRGAVFVTPAPATLHQRAIRLLLLELNDLAESLGLEVMLSPSDVRADEYTQVQPDLYVVPCRYPGRGATRWEVMQHVVLAIEVLSPGTTQLDREKKRELYLAEGVAEYWIVDLAARAVQVWVLPSVARTVREVLTWTPVGGAASHSIDLPAFFRRVHNER